MSPSRHQALHGGASRPREGAPSQDGGERRKRVKFSECVIYSDYSVNVLNDNPAFKAECVFVSSPTHQDGDQEAEVASFLVSLVSVSVDSIAYLARCLLKE